MIARSYAVDPHRIYAAGLSAGGAMSSVMAATYPDLFAAVGSGSGCEYASTATCAGYKSADPALAAQQAYREMGSRASPMPFIAFQGDQDTTVPPENADQLVQQWLTTDDLADDGALNGSVSQAAAKTTLGLAPGGESYTQRSYVDKGKAELAQVLGRPRHEARLGPAATRLSSTPTRTGPTRRQRCTRSSLATPGRESYSLRPRRGRHPVRRGRHPLRSRSPGFRPSRS